jgi:hypothetical protein
LRSEHNLKFKLRNITETSRKKLSSVGNVVWINSSSIDCHWSRVLLDKHVRYYEIFVL